ncbi:hypothetical protein RB7535 [Rhodopirellula baltica SH 1]|uniref:Uncharacterized protein n=1 Tax=Rhodopirellula baltica (strain DSM 10527 / NCIMB 13988 / SH1) TaxID=243090 RepID=Q7UNK4_RHOBA|nr:hypothetical protein RB7535 [Rhodopirellula baltica SH 1]
MPSVLRSGFKSVLLPRKRKNTPKGQTCQLLRFEHSRGLHVTGPGTLKSFQPIRFELSCRAPPSHLIPPTGILDVRDVAPLCHFATIPKDLTTTGQHCSCGDRVAVFDGFCRCDPRIQHRPCPRKRSNGGLDLLARP